MTFKKNLRNPRKSSYQKGGPIFNQDAYKSFGAEANNAFQEGGNIKQAQGNKLFAYREGLGTKMVDMHSRFPIPSPDGTGYFYNYKTSNGEQSIIPEQDVINQANENNFRNLRPFLLNNKGVTDTLYMSNGIHVNDLPPFEEGGIQIKPENKGKFTQYKKRTGKTTEEALHSNDPHVRKMAQFALNSKHWRK